MLRSTKVLGKPGVIFPVVTLEAKVENFLGKGANVMTTLFIGALGNVTVQVLSPHIEAGLQVGVDELGNVSSSAFNQPSVQLLLQRDQRK